MMNVDGEVCRVLSVLPKFLGPAPNHGGTSPHVRYLLRQLSNTCGSGVNQLATLCPHISRGCRGQKNQNIRPRQDLIE